MTTRVLLWSPLGSGEHYHGPGAFAYRLYRSAPADRVTVELAHAFAGQSEYSLFAAQHRIRPAPSSAAGLGGFLLQSRRWLARTAHRFDVMHCLTGFHASVAPAHFAQRLGLPAVVFVAAHDLEFVDKAGLRGLFRLARARRRMVRELSALIAMSRAIHDELLEIGVDPRRIARIPMGVDVQRFRPASNRAEQVRLRGELGIADMPTLIFVGGVTPRKRPHLLIEAVGRLRAARQDYQLVLAGPEQDASYAAAMRERASLLGISGQVRWLGHLPNIEQALRAADLFALPSANEGMPAALVEAMASGLPCIATRISGCEDLIEHETNGFFVAPEIDEIAAVLSTYLREPHLAAAHGARARAKVIESCSNETVLAAHLSLFECIRRGGDPADASTFGRCHPIASFLSYPAQKTGSA